MLLSLFCAITFTTSSTTYSLSNKNGAWSFTSPQNKSFWSLGVCCVNPGTTPAQYSPANPSYVGVPKDSSESEWVRKTQQALINWGINSTAGWSSDDLLRKHGGTSRLPYFVVLHLGSYYRAPWDDMFSAEFEKVVEKAGEDLIPQYREDVKLVGYFSDNELGWWDDALFLHYLAMGPTSAGKHKLVRLARRHYKSDFTLFSKDWITKCHSFDDLLTKDTKIFLKPGGKGMGFVNLLTYELAKRYYSVMHQVIRTYDKAHLILGDRYAQYWELPVLEAAKPYVDVISTNYGAEFLDGSLSHYFLSTIYNVTKKPVLISEFYWNAMENRSGNKNSTRAFPIVQTQEQRSKSLSVNLKSLASLPYVVGAHWFQFYDEPEKGRPDGEDNNMGLIDIHGQPYELVVDAFKNLDAVRLHSMAREAQSSTVLPRAPINPMTDLLNWPRSEGWIKPKTGKAFADLYLCYDAKYLYAGIHAMDFVYPDLYQDKSVPESERPSFELKIGASKPLLIRLMADRPAKASGLEDVLISEVPGVKHTCIVAIPWHVLGGKKPGDLSLYGTMHQHSRAATMKWASKVSVQ